MMRNTSCPFANFQIPESRLQSVRIVNMEEERVPLWAQFHMEWQADRIEELEELLRG